jgi:single-stranded DNA-binding protein
MGDTNLFGGVVKILETPQQKNLNQNIVFTQFRVQFPQVRKTSLIQLTFWGNLARDTVNHYKINDYILIEGYISLREKKISSRINLKSKQVEVTVLKIYPLVISSD